MKCSVPTDAMNIWQDLIGSLPGRNTKGVVQILGQSAEDATATAIYLAASPEVESKGQKGKYFIPIATENKTSKLAEDEDLVKKLWCWCDGQVTQALGRAWERSPAEIEETRAGT